MAVSSASPVLDLLDGLVLGFLPGSGGWNALANSPSSDFFPVPSGWDTGACNLNIAGWGGGAFFLVDLFDGEDDIFFVSDFALDWLVNDSVVSSGGEPAGEVMGLLIRARRTESMARDMFIRMYHVL